MHARANGVATRQELGLLQLSKRGGEGNHRQPGFGEHRKTVHMHPLYAASSRACDSLDGAPKPRIIRHAW